jgi:NAD(P)-dependent dehydrogenase (short-subunit alcohol dehydrogenase family)
MRRSKKHNAETQRTMNLDEKVCLVTGGTSGLGAATAQTFIRRGAHVVAVSRSVTGHEQVIDQLNKSAKSGGRKVAFIQADVSDSAECRRVAHRVQDEFGRVDVFVHAAGMAVPGNLFEVSVEEWKTAFDTHIHAIFHLARALVPGMKERHEGAIILIGSAAGLRGCSGALAYGVVKGALPQFARALARELAEFNVRVNCVSPGVIRTPFQNSLTPEQVRNNIEFRIPLHREGEPQDVASAVALLVENNFITGENITVDGGLTMRIA